LAGEVLAIQRWRRVVVVVVARLLVLARRMTAAVISSAPWKICIQRLSTAAQAMTRAAMPATRTSVMIAAAMMPGVLARRTVPPLANDDTRRRFDPAGTGLQPTAAVAAQVADFSVDVLQVLDAVDVSAVLAALRVFPA